MYKLILKKLGLVLAAWYVVTIFLVGNVACYVAYDVIFSGGDWTYIPSKYMGHERQQPAETKSRKVK